MAAASETQYILTENQCAVLQLFYRFRFVSSSQLSCILNRTNSTIHERLQFLQQHGYIDRTYNGQYRLQGRPAEYFILEDGIKALKQHRPDKCSTRALHNLYKDKNASPEFVAHSLALCTIYCRLYAQYGASMIFLTKNQMYPFTHFPKQKPDAFIRINKDGKRYEFFVELMDPNSRFFAYVGRIRRYIEYADSETWQDATRTKLPKILYVADSVSNEIRFRKQANRLLRSHFSDDPKFYTTSLQTIAAMKTGAERVWRDAEEPDRPFALYEL